MIVQPDFLTHWKTRKLCARLKEKHAPLYVIRLWSLCQTSKRDLIPADHETLAAICEYDGDSLVLLSALLDCGFIEPEKEGNHVVHGWAEINRQLIHNWTAGLSGGRPKVHKDKPKDIPRVSQTKPIDGLDRGIDKKDKIDESNILTDLWSLDQALEIASSPSVSVSRALAQECFDHYACQGWLNGSGNPVGRTRNELGALLRKWKTAAPSIRKSMQDVPENETQAEKALRVEKMIRGIK
jgi:hypothetical protein